MDHFTILKKAFHITFRHPELWVLGLFLSGGFNTNFFYWANLRWNWRDRGASLVLWLNAVAPHHIIVGLLLVLFALFGIMLVANWAKIIFILRVSDLLRLQRMRPADPDLSTFQESPRYLPAVVAISVFTVISMALITAILGGSPRLLFASHGLVWLLAAILFLALVLFFSCLNIFGTFFVIFYRRRFASAINLAFDLIVSRWRPILEMAVLLVVIYALGFFVGTALLSVIFIRPVGGAVLWLWLAVVNTFFNVSLLLLFARLVRPPYHPEFKSLLADLPAAAPAAQMMDKI